MARCAKNEYKRMMHMICSEIEKNIREWTEVSNMDLSEFMVKQWNAYSNK